MSRWLGRADELKAHLEALPALAGVPVIVDRQKDIESEVALGVGKEKGAAISIFWTGGTNPTPAATELKMGGSYVIRVWCLPVIAESEGYALADNLAEAVAEAVHDWSPYPTRPHHLKQRLAVSSVELEPHLQFLIYAIEAKAERL